MKRIYICSPYRAKNEGELDRNIDYAQRLTAMVLKNGDVPITPHLYITQCVNDSVLEEREIGLRAGLELLKMCDMVFVGAAYGISEGMEAEIRLARSEGIDISTTYE